MDCTFARGMIQDQLDDRFDAHEPGDVADFEAHLAICAQCAAERDELGAVTTALESLERVPAPDSLRDAVMERVLARGRPRPLGFDFPGGWPALSAVAALLLVAVILFVPERPDEDPVDRGVAVTREEGGSLDGDEEDFFDFGGRRQAGETKPRDATGERAETKQRDEESGRSGGALAADDRKGDGPPAETASVSREIRFRVEDPKRSARLLALALEARTQALSEVRAPGAASGGGAKELGGADAGDGGGGTVRARSGRGAAYVDPSAEPRGGAKSADEGVREAPSADPAPRPARPIPAGAVVVELTEEEYAFLEDRLAAMARAVKDPDSGVAEPAGDAPFEGADAEGAIGSDDGKRDADDEAPRTEEDRAEAERETATTPGGSAAPGAPGKDAEKIAKKAVRKIRVVLVPVRTSEPK